MKKRSKDYHSHYNTFLYIKDSAKSMNRVERDTFGTIWYFINIHIDINIPYIMTKILIVDLVLFNSKRCLKAQNCREGAKLSIFHHKKRRMFHLT